MSVLEEFLNENMHRNYPILDGGSAQDLTGRYNIPTDLITDIYLCVPMETVDEGIYFISGLIVRRYTVDVEISYKETGESAFVIGWFHNISTSADMFQSYSFVSIDQTSGSNYVFEDTTGTLMAGTGLGAILTPGLWEFDEISTPLIATAMNEGPTQFRSLQIGDELITGNVILEEGDNVTIETQYEAFTDTTTITFSAALAVSELETPLVDDASLLTNLTALYGTPITKINNLIPDPDGNFELAEADCINISNYEHSITFSNPCGEPCCDKESYLTPVYNSVDQLNARHVRLENFLEQATADIGTVLTRMENLENSIGIGDV